MGDLTTPGSDACLKHPFMGQEFRSRNYQRFELIAVLELL